MLIHCSMPPILTKRCWHSAYPAQAACAPAARAGSKPTPANRRQTDEANASRRVMTEFLAGGELRRNISVENGESKLLAAAKIAYTRDRFAIGSGAECGR
jgi:hypothetical protein